jgi:prepilin-type N-terminal cleavage/methylation domain-containing protein
MTGRLSRHARRQDGYTLVEVIITCALGAILMSALTSVILTSVRAGITATSRVEASGQIRSFQSFAYDDFAHSGVPSPTGCGTAGNPCTTQPIVLDGLRASNSPTPAVTQYVVTYRWDGTSVVNRQVGSTIKHAANSVTDFSWYLAGTGQYRTVVVRMTVTVQSYSESQSLRFYPRVNP